MKWLGKVLLVAVLLSLVVTPVFAGNSPDSFNIYARASTDAGNVSLHEELHPWRSYKVVTIGTPSFYCANADPAFDIGEIVQFREDGIVEIDVAFASSECDDSWGTVPDTISLDVTLTANTIYHSSLHGNVVKGEGANRNCQVWSSYDVEATGTIVGNPISSTFWADMYNGMCRYSGK